MGRVVDGNDDARLAGASVYFNNTTTGTISNGQGDFQFEMIDLLNNEMVISCRGYELLVYRLNTEQVKGKRIIFKLQAKTPVQRNKITLTDDGRKRWLDIFYSNFLGITKEASKCTISNAGSIYFIHGNNNTSFAAYADTPLVIINTMLGYKMHFDLVEFWHDEATGQDYILGYTRYEALGDNKKWIKNRQRCYYGSTLHFYRSLVKNQLYEEGFGTFFIQPAMDSVQKGRLTAEQAKAAEDIVSTIPITAQQILYIDSANNFSIRITGKLLVQYSYDPKNRRSSNRNIYIAGNLDKGFESAIVFKTAPLGINKAGVLSDTGSIEYTGYWIYEKAANVLPYDYIPEIDN